MARSTRTRGQSKATASGARGQRRPEAQDIPAILQAIVRTAARLCEAANAHIYQVEGDRLRLLAYSGSEPVRHVGQEVPITRELLSGRAVLERRTIHVRDVQTAAARRRYPGLAGFRHLRTMVAAPLLHDGATVGLIIIHRSRVRPFTAKQIALLQTFAGQAAIALENERLRETLEMRNRDLSEALEQQTATGEILRVISQLTHRRSARLRHDRAAALCRSAAASSVPRPVRWRVGTPHRPSQLHARGRSTRSSSVVPDGTRSPDRRRRRRSWTRPSPCPGSETDPEYVRQSGGRAASAAS